MNVDFVAQHRRRLCHMPWLYWSLKPRHLEWALPWQEQIQNRLKSLETVTIEGKVFVAEDASIFAEPGRGIHLSEGSSVASQSFLHGPLRLGRNVSINPHCHLDGGRKGIDIGDQTRVGAHTSIYAFDHGIAQDETPVFKQAVTSQGVRIGIDVWVGARVCIVDGVHIGDHAVVGMGAVVTKNVKEFEIVGGNPARVIGMRKKS